MNNFLDIQLKNSNSLQLIKEIKKNHQNNDLILSVSIIGSFAKQVQGENSDLDLLILTRIEIPESEVLKLFPQDTFFEKPYLNDDIYVLKAKFISLNLAYRTYDNFISFIKLVISGSEVNKIIKPWLVGGEIPEVILSDITFCNILFDKKGDLVSLSKNLRRDYPKYLRNTLINSLSNSIFQKITILRTFLKDGAFTLAQIGIGEIITDFTRIVFAHYQKYHFGLKHALVHFDHHSYSSECYEIKTIYDFFKKNPFYTFKNLDELLILIEKLTKLIFNEWEDSVAL